MKQGDEEWLAWRQCGLGGSDAAAVLGVSPWSTPYTLWLDKVGQLPPQTTNGAMQRGLDLEPEARRAYEAQTGIIVEPCTLEYPLWPIMRASLDGLSWDGKVCVEIKCVNKRDHALARLGKVPPHYVPQLHHLLAVSGAGVCHYWSYHPEEPPALIEVQPDPEYIAQLIALEKEFWDYVVRREPPPGYVPPEPARLDTDWIETARLYREAEAGMSEWEAKRKAARERLIVLAGPTTRAMGGGVTLTKLAKTVTDYARAAKEAGLALEKYQSTREEWRVMIAKGGKE